MLQYFFNKGVIAFLFLSIITQFYDLNSQSLWKDIDEGKLAKGNKFNVWEEKQKYSKIYIVSQMHPEASDDNPGTPDKPFKTISKAAEVLKPGEKVIIKEGIYRESVHPARGGTDPGHMITYEAAKGNDVVIKGSVVLNEEQWMPSKGWRIYKNDDDSALCSSATWQYSLKLIEFNGYNPFGMVNLMHDRSWLQHKKEVKMWPHFKRRGTIYLDGKPLKQVEKVTQLCENDSGAFWVEHNGLTVHVRFPFNTNPSDYNLIEASVKEQLFAPLQFGLGYIKLKGLTFMHAANGFPVPQRGMVSSSRGHHWVIENCRIKWANSLGIDLGVEIWSSDNKHKTGHHIIRKCIIKNCGISGLQAMGASNMLIEDNLFENIGWQDAELAFESGAIKLHYTNNTLIQRNIFRNITHAPGIWLDYLSSRNCRITKNIFSNITTARGGVYIEVSHSECRVDHNLFHNINTQFWLSGDSGAGGCALYTDGSDSIRFEHNMIVDVENSGYWDHINTKRIVGKRGGITRWHKVTDNIFIDCKEHAIIFPHKYNYANGNVYNRHKGGYIQIGNPEPSLLLDISAVNKLYGWEKDGIYLNKNKELNVSFDTEKTTISIECINPDAIKNTLANPPSIFLK